MGNLKWEKWWFIGFSLWFNFTDYLWRFRCPSLLVGLVNVPGDYCHWCYVDMSWYIYTESSYKPSRMVTMRMRGHSMGFNRMFICLFQWDSIGCLFVQQDVFFDRGRITNQQVAWPNLIEHPTMEIYILGRRSSQSVLIHDAAAFCRLSR